MLPIGLAVMLGAIVIMAKNYYKELEVAIPASEYRKCNPPLIKPMY
jgi:hypothetical protein